MSLAFLLKELDFLYLRYLIHFCKIQGIDTPISLYYDPTPIVDS